MGIIFDLDQTIINSSIASVERSCRKWQKVYSLIPDFTLYDGMFHLLQYLQQYHKICIVTSSPRPYFTRVTGYWKIPFDHSVCFHDVSDRKPAPEPILTALKLLDKLPCGVISVGDMDIDIIASKKAGVKSVGCMWGNEDNSSLIATKPNYIVNSVAELQMALENFFKQSKITQNL